ncbi:hypothetical protein F442_02351 [Phytophthora nicotianae P10297]|uniref:Chromo domain-containing protein n=1 Tax=Phytophthora nicotianae P10297 TaxID=1317064 RepID=W3A094_PHYNI|nr:hypothetical protein F442_02351 [Phytophthora nicotianae P10297]
MSYKEARNAWKYADRFVLSEDDVLHYLGLNRRYDHGWQEETKLRLVVPTTMIPEVLQNCLDSLEGGHQGVVRTFHRVKSDYYWIGLYADVVKYVKSCLDCSSITTTSDFKLSTAGQRLTRTLSEVGDDFRSGDTTRKETPFYLVHGWDARSTLRAMSSSLGRGTNRQSDALTWRREVNRQHEVALTMAKDYQAAEKERRAKEHNEALSRLEKAAVPGPRKNGRSVEDPEASSVPNDAAENPPRSLFEIGGRVWLYMERVEQFAYELELPDKSGYRFYPVVYVSSLKAVNEYPSRPKTRLTQDVTKEIRFDFDEELLPEDSWEPDHLAGEYNVEAILDDGTPLSTSTERAVREFKVKWVGYDEPTWEPSSNLSCGGLLYYYLRAKKSDRRLQMVQVADED